MMIEFEACVVTQSWVNREYRRGLSTHLYGALVLRISKVEVLCPTFTPWGRAVRMSRTQLQWVGFRPRTLSLMTSLAGTMVFAEL
jgi:hypothetical protein